MDIAKLPQKIERKMIMKFGKKILSLLLAVVMVLSLSSMAFAADNTLLSITGTVGGTTRTFETDSYTYTNPVNNQPFTAGTAIADFPVGTDLSNITLSIRYNGTALKINGTQVDASGSYSGSVNFTGSVVEIEVVQTSGSIIYYAAATAGNFSVSMSLNYDTLSAFAATTTGDYYQRAGYGKNDYMDAVTDDQKEMADFAYGYFSGLGLTSMTTTVASGSTPISLLAAYAAEKEISVTDSSGEEITASSTYVDAIEGVDMYYAGTYTYFGWSNPSGGWMFSVQRGNTIQFPTISAGYFKLMPGDVVTWYYTCDLGYDIGNPML